MLRSISIVLICAAAAFVLACGRPPLRVSTDGQSVLIDMQTLGEYPSDVERLRLTDATDKRVVWEVKGRGEPQLGSIQLRVGENAVAISDVCHGTYDVLVPGGAGTFKLEAGKRYVVEVWGKDDRPRTKREAELIVPGA